MKYTSLHRERIKARVAQKGGTTNLRTSHVQYGPEKVHRSGKAILMLFEYSASQSQIRGKQIYMDTEI
jgi:hypothetical protein